MAMDAIPLMPFPYENKIVKKVVRGFYPFSSLLADFFPMLDLELEDLGSRFEAKEYLGGALLTMTFYFLMVLILMAIYAYRIESIWQVGTRTAIFFISLLVSLAIFSYIVLFPTWRVDRKRRELEKNLLFAARHLMIQTSAGVPLFDSIVSVSEEYDDPKLNYGEISNEFGKIVREVRGGQDLSQALEDSSARNPSSYYRKLVWQLANANKAGVNVGFVLKEIVDFLSDEQRIMIRSYGSQLNPLALFYMLTCIIGPTMGIILLAVVTTISQIPVNEATLSVILLLLVVIQVVFIGLIKSRRPVVAL